MDSYHTGLRVVLFGLALLKEVTVAYADRSLYHEVQNAATFLRKVLYDIEVAKHFVPRFADLSIGHHFTDYVRGHTFDDGVGFYEKDR